MIRQDEPDPARRRVPFTASPGLTFGSGSILIQRAGGITERARGFAVETMPGSYYYELHPIETVEPGPLMLIVRIRALAPLPVRLDYDDRGRDWTRIPVRVEAPLDWDPEEPVAWADVHVEREPHEQIARAGDLTRLALDRGVQRRTGETDAALRDRLRARMAHVRGAFTLRDLEAGVLAEVADVVDCHAEQRPAGGIVLAVRARSEYMNRLEIPENLLGLSRDRARITEELRVVVGSIAPAGIRVHVALTIVGP